MDLRRPPWVSAWVVLAVLMAGCQASSDDRPDEGIGPASLDCPAEIQAVWSAVCDDAEAAVLSASDCSSPEVTVYIPAQWSQLPEGWQSRSLIPGMVGFDVLGYRCGTWSSGDIDLGAGTIAFVGEFVAQRDDDVPPGALYAPIYLLHSYTDNPLLLYHLQANGAPVANATFHDVEAGVGPFSYAFDGDDGATATLSIAGSETSDRADIVWDLYYGDASAPSRLRLDCASTLGEILPATLEASGGPFDAALPTGIGTSANSLIETSSMKIDVLA